MERFDFPSERRESPGGRRGQAQIRERDDGG